ncbi:ABC-2 family transporter protein [Corynebacterium capitovis DSM 44611]|uniref:YhgE/Pip domain-containing protein n=1 Tax=Corynebacterium capitovis TaxID=131081 RepID=UPI000379A420|nr:YhgE/Pip domain-containing protein [Corynebacterium capitovis]WKD56607.1 ABC-2 family transporter protein [Corynebacterium capitovis DSM 44611]
MISGTHLGTNFRKFGHGTLPPLAALVIVLLPLLFGGLFVWSYYDPLGNLSKMPVALVNSDEGAVGPDGSPLNAGEQVTQQLLEKRPLDFHVVSAEEARQGVADGTYYLGVEIPTDFSQAAASVSSDNPHQAKLNVTLNETNGFIPTMLGNQATVVMSNVISDTVGGNVINQLFVGFNTLGDGLDQAADGASRLNDGTGEASDGGKRLSDGANELNSGAHQLDSGIGQLSDGATQLDNGIGQLQDGANQLDAGINSAADGANQLADGMTQLQGGTDQLGSGASQVAGGVDRIASVADQLNVAQRTLDSINASIDQVIAGLEAAPVPGTEGLIAQARNIQSQLGSSELAFALNPEVVNQLLLLQSGAHQVADQLNDPTAQYRSGIDQAAAGAQQLAQGLGLLKDGSGTLVAGVAKLKDGSSQLVVGARAAADGSSKLAAGTDQLVVGVGTLNDGLVQLDDGAGELSLKLGQGAQQAPRWEGDRLTAATNAASTPVVQNQAGDGLTFFGKGLSPFFLSLALWVGGLALSMVLSPMSRRAVDSGVNPVRALLTALLPAFVFGAGQALLLWLVQVVVIGVEPAHPLRMLGALLLVSWSFMSLISAINVIFGAATGRLLTMALMSLQLVASNGLYPPEVQPKFIQWVHAVDPMRFSVDLLRHAMFGASADDPRLFTAILALVAFAAAGIVASALGNFKHRVIMGKDIHPELSV